VLGEVAVLLPLTLPLPTVEDELLELELGGSVVDVPELGDCVVPVEVPGVWAVPLTLPVPVVEDELLEVELGLWVLSVAVPGVWLVPETLPA
jgi:hypothetical protein